MAALCFAPADAHFFGARADTPSPRSLKLLATLHAPETTGANTERVPQLTRVTLGLRVSGEAREAGSKVAPCRVGAAGGPECEAL